MYSVRVMCWEKISIELSLYCPPLPQRFVVRCQGVLYLAITSLSNSMDVPTYHVFHEVASDRNGVSFTSYER